MSKGIGGGRPGLEEIFSSPPLSPGEERSESSSPRRESRNPRAWPTSSGVALSSRRDGGSAILRSALLATVAILTVGTGAVLLGATSGVSEATSAVRQADTAGLQMRRDRVANQFAQAPSHPSPSHSSAIPGGEDVRFKRRDIALEASSSHDLPREGRTGAIVEALPRMERVAQDGTAGAPARGSETRAAEMAPLAPDVPGASCPAEGGEVERLRCVVDAQRAAFEELRQELQQATAELQAMARSPARGGEASLPGRSSAAPDVSPITGMANPSRLPPSLPGLTSEPVAGAATAGASAIPVPASAIPGAALQAPSLPRTSHPALPSPTP